MPTTTTSASTAEPSVSRTCSTRPVPSIAADADAQSELDAVVAVQLRAGQAHRRARGLAANGTGRASRTVTSQPRPRAVAATSEPMNPAPTTTTRGEPDRERRPQREALVERAQHVDAVELGLVRAAADHRPRGDDQAVVGHALAVVDGYDALRHVEAGGGPAEPSVDVQRAEVAVAPQRDALGLPLPGQHLLGQRRPVVGLEGLGPDQGDATFEAFVAQRLDGAQTGQRSADDDHAPLHARTLPYAEPAAGARRAARRRSAADDGWPSNRGRLERRRPPSPERPKGREAVAELRRGAAPPSATGATGRATRRPGWP